MASHPSNARYPDATAITFDKSNFKVTVIYNDHSIYVWDVRDITKVNHYSCNTVEYRVNAPPLFLPCSLKTRFQYKYMSLRLTNIQLIGKKRQAFSSLQHLKDHNLEKMMDKCVDESIVVRYFTAFRIAYLLAVCRQVKRLNNCMRNSNVICTVNRPHTHMCFIIL